MRRKGGGTCQHHGERSVVHSRCQQRYQYKSQPKLLAIASATLCFNRRNLVCAYTEECGNDNDLTNHSGALAINQPTCR